MTSNGEPTKKNWNDCLHSFRLEITWAQETSFGMQMRFVYFLSCGLGSITEPRHISQFDFIKSLNVYIYVCVWRSIDDSMRQCHYCLSDLHALNKAEITDERSIFKIFPSEFWNVEMHQHSAGEKKIWLDSAHHIGLETHPLPSSNMELPHYIFMQLNGLCAILMLIFDGVFEPPTNVRCNVCVCLSECVGNRDVRASMSATIPFLSSLYVCSISYFIFIWEVEWFMSNTFEIFVAMQLFSHGHTGILVAVHHHQQ